MCGRSGRKEVQEQDPIQGGEDPFSVVDFDVLAVLLWFPEGPARLPGAICGVVFGP